MEVEMYLLKINLAALVLTMFMVTSLIQQTLSDHKIFLPVDSKKLMLEADEQKIVYYNQNVESVLSLKIVTSPTVEELSFAEKLIFEDFSGISHSFNLEKFKEQEGPQYLCYGTMEKGLGSITLIHINNQITGTIRINGDLYKIIPINRNLNIISFIDQSSFIPEDPFDDNYKTENSAELNNTFSKTEATSDVTPIIRVLVAYTSVVAANHDENGLIATAIAETNQSFTNSGIDAELELAHKYQVTYTETGSMETDLSRFRINGDGYMDEVHQKRNQYYADVCMLITETGNHYGLASDIWADSYHAFAQSRADGTTGNYTFGHEIGHLMAARHNIEVDNNPLPYEDGHGYLYKIGSYNGQWRTIMGVLDEKYCPSCPRIQYWSNPSKYYGLVPMGNSIHANVTRVWNIEASRLAGFRSDPPVVFTVSISGPTLLGYNQQGTFTANPSGGSGTYTNYRWWERKDEGGWVPQSVDGGIILAPPPGQWIEQTGWEGQQTVQVARRWDFSLKCEVTDSDNNTASDIHSVDVGGGLAKAQCELSEINNQSVPENVELTGNYPNPFNPSTTIKFGLPEETNIKITIYSSTGQKIVALADGIYSKGYHGLVWDGKNQAGNSVSNGIYIYELKAGNQRLIKKMVFTK
jgi:hypothetical protein